MLDHLIDKDEAVYTASDKALEAAGEAYTFLRQRRGKLAPDVIEQIQRLMYAIDELLEGENQ